MQGVEHRNSSFTRSAQDLQHMRNTFIGFGNCFYAIPDLASLGNEIVVWIDQDQCSDLFLVSHSRHPVSSFWNRKRPRLPASKRTNSPIHEFALVRLDGGRRGSL